MPVNPSRIAATPRKPVSADDDTNDPQNRAESRAPRITLDLLARTGYAHFINAAISSTVEAIPDMVLVDFDAAGRVVGVEILSIEPIGKS